MMAVDSYIQVMPPRHLTAVALACALLLPLGCGGGGGAARRANLDLRKRNQALTTQVAKLEAESDQLRSDVRRLESEREVLPTLPQERLEGLWTVAGLEFGRLTGVDERADGRPLKVYLKPVDQDGSTLKAAGSITVEAFDLAADAVRLGRWQFPLDQVKRHWVSGGLLNEYLLTCHWEGDPPAEGRKLVVKATFHDALTQRTFEARTDVP